MPETTPQDHKTKPDGIHKFTVKGKTYSLPAVDEKVAAKVPGEITYNAVMNPDDDAAQLRLAFATLEAVGPKPAALAALKSLPTDEMMKVVGNWMGEASSSSD